MQPSKSVKYHSALTIEEMLQFATTWINLEEDIMLSKISHRRTNTNDSTYV